LGKNIGIDKGVREYRQVLALENRKCTAASACNLDDRAPFPGGEGNIQIFLVDARSPDFVSIYYCWIETPSS